MALTPGPSVTSLLNMSHQMIKVEGYVRERIKVVSKVLCLIKKEPHQLVHLMRHASKKI